MFREGLNLGLERLGSCLPQNRMSHSYNLIQCKVAISLVVRYQMAELFAIPFEHSGTRQQTV
jgi:hypothetical protein